LQGGDGRRNCRRDGGIGREGVDGGVGVVKDANGQATKAESRQHGKQPSGC